MREHKRDELVTESEEVRAAILGAARGLRPSDWSEVFLGFWTAEDLLAHLQGWDWINLGAIHEVRAGRLPGFYALHDRDWETLNRHLVAECKTGRLPALARAARQSHARLMGAVRGIDPADCDRDFGVRVRGVRVTIERLLRWELADEKAHLAQLRPFASGRTLPT